MEEEQAKAVQEIAKTASKGLEASEKLGGFLSKILGEGLIDLGSAFSDWAKTYRYTNLIKLIDKVEKIHLDRKLEGKIIPILPKYVQPILQEASLEDDDDVRELWAGLIANATDPNIKFQIKKLYIEILSSIDPIDAEILKYLYNPEISESYGLLSGNLNSEKLAINLGRNIEDIRLSLSNLLRLNLIIDAYEETLENMAGSYPTNRVNSVKANYRLSYLGDILLENCSQSHISSNS